MLTIQFAWKYIQYLYKKHWILVSANICTKNVTGSIILAPSNFIVFKLSASIIRKSYFYCQEIISQLAVLSKDGEVVYACYLMVEGLSCLHDAQLSFVISYSHLEYNPWRIIFVTIILASAFQHCLVRTVSRYMPSSRHKAVTTGHCLCLDLSCLP